MDKIRKYYWLCPKSYKGEPIADAPEGLPCGSQMLEWIKDMDALPFDLTLYDVKVTSKRIHNTGVSSQIPIDYVANSEALPMMSGKMRTIIETGLNGNEGVRWMSARIHNATDTFQYFVPVFTKFLDTLDMIHTEFHSKATRAAMPEPFKSNPYWNIIKPYYKKEVVQQYGMFHKCGPFWQITTGIYLRADIMKALKQQKITGVAFSTEALLV